MRKFRKHVETDLFEDLEEGMSELGLTGYGYSVQRGRDNREYEKYKQLIKEQRLLDQEFKKQHPDYNGK